MFRGPNMSHLQTQHSVTEKDDVIKPIGFGVMLIQNNLV